MPWPAHSVAAMVTAPLHACPDSIHHLEAGSRIVRTGGRGAWTLRRLGCPDLRTVGTGAIGVVRGEYYDDPRSAGSSRRSCARPERSFRWPPPWSGMAVAGWWRVASPRTGCAECRTSVRSDAPSDRGGGIPSNRDRAPALRWHTDHLTGETAVDRARRSRERAPQVKRLRPCPSAAAEARGSSPRRQLRPPRSMRAASKESGQAVR